MHRRIGTILSTLLAVLPATNLIAQAAPGQSPTIVFVCEHGAAKSVIATAYFNKLAADRHLPFRATFRGTSPQEALSVRTLEGLRSDNVPVPTGKPTAITEADISKATHIFAIGCTLPVAAVASGKSSDWTDVPDDQGYPVMRDAIVRRVTALLDDLQTPNTSRDSAARVFVLSGFSIEAPSETGWVAQAADRKEAVFQKRTADSSVRLVAYAIATEFFADAPAFLKFAEARQEAAFSGLQRVSSHFNYTRLKGAACLQYDGIFRDTLAAASEQQFLNTRGYLCRHPTAAGQAVGLEFTQRSGSRTPPDIEHSLKVAEDFFNSVVFTNAEPVR